LAYIRVCAGTSIVAREPVDGQIYATLAGQTLIARAHIAVVAIDRLMLAAPAYKTDVIRAEIAIVTDRHVQ
jgi:hypothetical protein